MLEFQLTPDSIRTIHVWLTALLGVSYFLTSFFLLYAVSFAWVLKQKYIRFSKLLLAFLASLQIFAWQLYFYSDSHDRVALWCFPLALVGGVFVWRLSNVSFVASPFLARAFPVALLLISFAELGGFANASGKFGETALLSNLASPRSNLAAPGTLVERTAICGTTDNGKLIRLFERQVTANAFREYLERCRSTFSSTSERAMLRAQPFIQSNCHGWVFTQGQHVVLGEDVQLILDDNNYAVVAQPQINDVAVYRSEDGVIVHTGVVRGSLENATLVESKWGIGALYMHVAEEQPYARNISYYRTDRPSHDILIGSANPKFGVATENLLLANQTIDDSVKGRSFDTHFCSSQSE